MFAVTKIRRRLLPVALLAIGLLVVGCGIFSPDQSKTPPGGGGGNSFPPSTSPDILMQNFENAWQQMNIVEYEKLLDDEFQFFFSPSDSLQDFVGESWDRTKELASTGAMFSNQPGSDPKTGEPISPILSIEFTNFSPQLPGGWIDPGTDPLYAGTVLGRYKVGITVTFQAEGQISYVTGDNDFYVKGYPQQDGTTLYKIKVWEDRAQDLGG
jgi:hypothetical protein